MERRADSKDTCLLLVEMIVNTIVLAAWIMVTASGEEKKRMRRSFPNFTIPVTHPEKSLL